MSRKILVTGDVHGREFWKEIIVNENGEFDKFIFLGDYFDSREGIQEHVQWQNFEDILELKEKHPEKVTLLFGNHDYHYLPSTHDRYSLFNYQLSRRIDNQLIRLIQNRTLELIHIDGKYLFSHAGVSQKFLERNRLTLDNLNDKFRSDPGVLNFGNNMMYSSYGDDITQSPIWIRPESLLRSKLEDYIHVIGHTQVTDITSNEGIILTDVLGTKKQYLKLEETDGEYTEHIISI